MASASEQQTIDNLARRLAAVEDRVITIQEGNATGQLEFSSIDINTGKGYLSVFDGEIERGRIGRMPDGTVNMVSANNDVPPSKPNPPIVTPIIGGCEVTVQSLVAEIPYDFGYLKVRCNGTHVGNIIRVPGSLIVAPLDPALSHTISISAVNLSGTESAFTEDIVVQPLSVVSGIDFGEITETLIADNAITTPKLLAAAITAAKIAVGAVEADKIKAGAVTADKLEAILAVVTRLVAGNPVAARSEFSDRGFEQYAGNGQLLVQFGASPGQGGSNIITIVDAGNPNIALCTIDSQGIISASGVNVGGQLRLKGVALDDILYNLPRGLVCYGRITGASNPSGSTRRAVYEMSFQAEAGRSYRFASSVFNVGNQNAGYPAGALQLRYTADGSRPTVNSTLMCEAIASDLAIQGSGAGTGGEFRTYSSSISNTEVVGTHSHGMPHTHLAPDPQHAHDVSIPGSSAKFEVVRQVVNNANIRLLFCIASEYGGSVTLSPPTGDSGIQFYVEDVGPNVNATGGISAGDGTGGGGTGLAVTTFPATWSRSWIGNAQQTPNDLMYQGNYQTGDAQCLIGFNTTGIQQLLAGVSSVSKVELFLYSTNSFNSTGADAVIGTHQFDNPPGNYSWYTRNLMRSGAIKRPGGRWVTLPLGIWPQMRDGLVKGYLLDQRVLGVQGIADPNDPLFVGTFAGANDAINRPALRFTYIA